MPFFQAMLGTLNQRFCAENIGQLAEAKHLFEPSDDNGHWLDRMTDLPGPPRNTVGVGYLKTLPAGLLEMLRALVHENLSRGDDAVLPITWAWAPAYDFEVQAWECPGTAGSRGAFTILIKSRYPGDTHPGGPSSSAN